MSHELTNRDRMAYVGQKPWHFMETAERCSEIKGTESAEEIAKLAGLDFSVDKVQLYAFLPVGQGDEQRAVPVEDIFGIVVERQGEKPRLLPKTSVGGVFTPMQNDRLLRPCARLVDTGKARWETAGSLKEGRLVWAMLKLPEIAVAIRRGKDGRSDRHETYLNAAQGHDGTRSIEVYTTDVRCVCWNTLTWGRREGLRIPHTASSAQAMAAAYEEIEKAIDSRKNVAEVLQELADAPFARSDMEVFAAQLLTGKDDPEEAVAAFEEELADEEHKQRAANLRQRREALLGLFEHGPGNLGRDRYDGFNAVTDFVDHPEKWLKSQKARNAEWKQLARRFESGQFGTGARLKKRALRLLTRS